MHFKDWCSIKVSEVGYDKRSEEICYGKTELLFMLCRLIICDQIGLSFLYLMFVRPCIIRTMWATNKMQQIPFIGLLKTALHVSGHKFSHPREHFLTVYTAFGTTHRYCCRPVPPVSSNIGALYQKLYIQSKSAPEDGWICRLKHVELVKKVTKWMIVFVPCT